MRLHAVIQGNLDDYETIRNVVRDVASRWNDGFVPLCANELGL